MAWFFKKTKTELIIKIFSWGRKEKHRKKRVNKKRQLERAVSFTSIDFGSPLAYSLASTWRLRWARKSSTQNKYSVDKSTHFIVRTAWFSSRAETPILSLSLSWLSRKVYWKRKINSDIVRKFESRVSISPIIHAFVEVQAKSLVLLLHG